MQVNQFTGRQHGCGGAQRQESNGKVGANHITHVKRISMFIHMNDRVKVACRKFMDKESDVDVARLESVCPSYR